MKLYRLIFICFLIFSCNDIGEGYGWNSGNKVGFSRNYGTRGYDYGWNASFSPFDDGIIIVGQRSEKIGGNSDLWGIKTDSRGVVQWEAIFGGDRDEAGFDVISTSDGGFLFVGYTWSMGNNQQVYVIKTDSNGIKQWAKTYGGSMWEVGFSVIEVSEGYVIAGFSNSPGISSGNTDMYLIKINSKGELIWQKAYGNQEFPNHEWAYDIVEKNDEGLIFVGSRDRYKDGGLNGLMISTDKNGNILWEKEFFDNDQSSETIFSISKSINGGYYLCASINSSNDPKVFKPKIIKTGEYGNIDWERTFNSDSKEYHQFRAVSSSLGGAVLIGTSRQTLSDKQNEDALMIRVDGKGNILWTHSYGTADADDWGWAIFEKPSSNLVFVGSTKSFGASLFDIYLVGTSSNGITY